jgi:hypothetical protein
MCELPLQNSFEQRIYTLENEGQNVKHVLLGDRYYWEEEGKQRRQRRVNMVNVLYMLL